jgi:uncharacterized protein (TIGR03084 family)
VATGIAMLGQAIDFRDECDVLHAALREAPAVTWERRTQFQGWSFDDILGHLHIFDYAASLSARDRNELVAFFGDLRKTRAEGVSLTEYTRRWLGGLCGPALLERWHDYSRELAGQYHTLAPDLRVAWGGPDMSVRSLISARQMETWAHGQAMFDLLGVERVEHDRLRNIAVMGVNTFGWSFVVHGLEVPAQKPWLRLTSPSGALWEWNDPAAGSRIEGSAVEFCRVVTQTRNVLDTRLQVEGAEATAWMAVAQCFAGPPVMPPAPGSRHRQQSR